jgi:hypothetical protein
MVSFLNFLDRFDFRFEKKKILAEPGRILSVVYQSRFRFKDFLIRLGRALRENNFLKCNIFEAEKERLHFEALETEQQRLREDPQPDKRKRRS